MSKNKDKVDLNTSGRVHDGYAYLVTYRNCESERFFDADPPAAVIARWQQALSIQGGYVVTFSGAHRANGNIGPLSKDAENFHADVGPLEGAGGVLATDIAAIREWSAEDDVDDEAEEKFGVIEEALGKVAEALTEIKGEVEQLRDDVEELYGEEDGDEQEETPQAPAPVQVLPDVSDEDLDG